jgi:hypothetical protein
MPRREHPEMSNNRVRNNIIGGSGTVDLVVYHHPEAAKGNVTENNLFWPGEGKRVKIARTADPDYRINYTDLRKYARDTGNETRSVVADPRWRDRSSGDYSLKAGSPAAGIYGIPNRGVTKPNDGKGRGGR